MSEKLIRIKQVQDDGSPWIDMDDDERKIHVKLVVYVAHILEFLFIKEN